MGEKTEEFFYGAIDWGDAVGVSASERDSRLMWMETLL